MIIQYDVTNKINESCINQLLAAIRGGCENNRSIRLVKSAEQLDVDTAGKDSYQLFEAGLDFVMLVTDKQRYLKSSHNISQLLPRPLATDWVLQIGEVYSPDVVLTQTDSHILTDDGARFNCDDINALTLWLENRYANDKN